MNREVKILIVLGAIALGLVLLMIFLGGKKSNQIAPSPTLAPVPSPTTTLSPLISRELPYTADGFTIEYFSDDGSYFVQINKAPYEKYATQAKKWFTDHGLNPDILKIVWSSTRGIAPTQ